MAGSSTGGSANAGSAGSPDAGGEGGGPTEPECEPPLVRCRADGYREHCADDGFWVAESFACTTGLAGSVGFSRMCSVKAASGEIACFSFEPNPHYEQLVAAFPDEHWVEVAVSDDNSSMCALSREGELVCIQYPTSPLRRFEGPFSTAAISVSGTCGVLHDGTISCPEGSLPVPTGEFATLSLAGQQMLAIRRDGTLFQAPARLPPEERYIDVHTDLSDACGILANGSLVCGLGDQRFSEVRDETFVEVVRELSGQVCARREDGTLACWSDVALENALEAPSGQFTALGTHYNGFCAIRTDGTTTCWSPTPADAMRPPPGW